MRKKITVEMIIETEGSNDDIRETIQNTLEINPSIDENGEEFKDDTGTSSCHLTSIQIEDIEYKPVLIKN